MAEIKAVTTASFDQDVVAASRTRPVVVDFWAPWCGPCRMLSPVLEEVARELGDRVSVVKINTDEEPELAQRFGIRGIPAVKLFRDGRVAAEFTGVQPAAAVRAFIAPHLPRESEAERQAALALADNDLDAAITSLREVIGRDPENSAAALDLARLLARSGRTAEAESVLDSLPAATQLQPETRAARAYVHLAGLAATQAPEAPGDGELVRERAEAARALLRGEVEPALERLLKLMESDRGFARGAGRSDLLQAFELVGTDDPRIPPFRRRLASLLH